MAEAVRQAVLWERAGSPVVVSVNVSALQFQQSDFVERVASALQSSGLTPELLELELTESILVRDADEALARLQESAGIPVATTSMGKDSVCGAASVALLGVGMFAACGGACSRRICASIPGSITFPTIAPRISP